MRSMTYAQKTDALKHCVDTSPGVSWLEEHCERETRFQKRCHAHRSTDRVLFETLIG